MLKHKNLDFKIRQLIPYIMGFCIVTVFACQATIKINASADKKLNKKINQLIAQFEKAVHQQNAKALLQLMHPEYLGFLKDEFEQSDTVGMMKSIFNTVTNEGSIERFGLSEIKKIEFISIQEWEKDKYYGMTYRLFLTENRQRVKDTFRIIIKDVNGEKRAFLGSASG